MGLCRDLTKLQPNVQDAAEKAIAILKAQGIRFFINETLRYPATQKAYYAQGRVSLEEVNALREAAGLWDIGEKENERKVTNTLESVHLKGMALDIVPSDKWGNPNWNATEAEYKAIATVMKTCGFEWGGDWSGSWDKPHYQMKA